MFDVQGNCCEECQSKYQNNQVGKITCSYGSDKLLICQHGKLKNGKTYSNAQKCYTYMKNSSTKITYNAVYWDKGSASNAKKLAKANPGKTYCYGL